MNVEDELSELPTIQSDADGVHEDNVLEAPILEETALSIFTVDPGNAGAQINPYILGTNVPAWLASDRMDNVTFQAHTLNAGVSLIRIPGGSWSNYYDWLACERGGEGIDETAECYWIWAARPTDFINFLRDTGLEGMYTINMNGTAKEAAALVAFFNGSVDDDTVIGVDVRGRDWGTVGDWATLRSENGNPEPLGLRYFEIGNEIYGGKGGMGTDCVSGWEDVWTCDGTEYVNGIGSGSERKEGFLEYREAMQAVDPNILVGAVGITYQDEWSNWGNEVIAAAGDVMDFYIIHHYGFFTPPATFAEALAEPTKTWPAVIADVQAAFDEYANGRSVPVAITEYNLFSVQDQDNGQLMTRLVNALYTADTVGQMMSNGVQIAAQWDLANGQAGNGSDYGLIHAETYDPYPQYYTYVLWSRFGAEMLPVLNPLPADTTLSIYAGRIDENTVSILAINKTADPLETAIQLENSPAIASGLVDILTGDSLEATAITFNGNSSPAADFSDAPSEPLTINSDPFTFTFPPYSITLLRLKTDS
ncbi:MAG: alpha-L-arabinofuranosidase [Ardenticatenaceae bacterium]|nr:alpha-L-arabinofuranosidase [Ardenticatenaceae bacterium]MCB8982100.1 alpha-L-arabinofuranosidase [Ardenticatenaceae bacterium]